MTWSAALLVGSSAALPTNKADWLSRPRAAIFQFPRRVAARVSWNDDSNFGTLNTAIQHSQFCLKGWKKPRPEAPRLGLFGFSPTAPTTFYLQTGSRISIHRGKASQER